MCEQALAVLVLLYLQPTGGVVLFVWDADCPGRQAPITGSVCSPPQPSMLAACIGQGLDQYLTRLCVVVGHVFHQTVPPSGCLLLTTSRVTWVVLDGMCADHSSVPQQL